MLMLAVMLLLYSSRKYPYSRPPTEGIGISWGVRGSVRPKHLKKCMKLNENFQRGWGVPPFYGGGTDIFWNYTSLCHNIHTANIKTELPSNVIMAVL